MSPAVSTATANGRGGDGPEAPPQRDDASRPAMPACRARRTPPARVRPCGTRRPRGRRPRARPPARGRPPRRSGRPGSAGRRWPASVPRSRAHRARPSRATAEGRTRRFPAPASKSRRPQRSVRKSRRARRIPGGRARASRETAPAGRLDRQPGRPGQAARLREQLRGRGRIERAGRSRLGLDPPDTADRPGHSLEPQRSHGALQTPRAPGRLRAPSPQRPADEHGQRAAGAAAGRAANHRLTPAVRPPASAPRSSRTPRPPTRRCGPGRENTRAPPRSSRRRSPAA